MSVSWNGETAPIPPGGSYGYARVSTTDQDLELQYKALERAGCRVIRAEKVSGTSVQGRAELRILLDFIRPGDELVVTRVDRLARSMGDLQDIIRELKSKQATLRATEQPIDTSTRCARLWLPQRTILPKAETPFGIYIQPDAYARERAEVALLFLRAMTDQAASRVPLPVSWPQRNHARLAAMLYASDLRAAGLGQRAIAERVSSAQRRVRTGPRATSAVRSAVSCATRHAMSAVTTAISCARRSGGVAPSPFQLRP